ncbi:putative palmitoyltransferase ZDHHC4 [Willisornis vidua]|uniref:Palmitoyltransferase n=1 Tax=Willisornis vidua TaxID=1566151 RepID=A0ABQ9DDK9_9PASS|nr:putative palmitoyltransferase ZDHHC4 [Willisornis vidua]
MNLPPTLKPPAVCPPLLFFLHGEGGQELELPREVVESPSLEVSREQLDVALSALGCFLRAANVSWQNILWPVAVAYFVNNKVVMRLCSDREEKSKGHGINAVNLAGVFRGVSCLFVVLHVALQAAVFGEYTWEVFGYCWELQFPLLVLLLPYLLLAGNLSCFTLCSRANPGLITKANHASLVKVYAYDGLMFQRGNVCPTCTLEKPARSKHCSVCRACVHRFDHHCVWLNTCVGAGTARWFLLYLLSLAGTATALAAITATLLLHLGLLSRARHGTYRDAQGQERPVDFPVLVQHLFLTFPRIVFMLGFVILLTLILGGYSSFTLYLAFTNQTTNECSFTFQPGKWGTEQNFSILRRVSENWTQRFQTILLAFHIFILLFDAAVQF